MGELGDECGQVKKTALPLRRQPRIVFTDA